METQVASYTYDSWGKLISIKDATGSDITNNTTHVGYKNPYRYRGYRYDTETGLYYLQSRYYNPEWGRFINADALIGQTGELLGHNMFAYCANDPINMKDDSGFLHSQALDNFGGGGGGAGVIPTGGALLDCLKGFYYATVGTIGAIGSAIGMQSITNSTHRSNSKSYTEYCLSDRDGDVKYVGRTKNFDARMKQHQKPNSRTKGLIPTVRIDNLSYSQARGLEQLGMMYYHTRLFRNENGVNLINGISTTRLETTPYLQEGRSVYNYLYNQISNEFLNWAE